MTERQRQGLRTLFMGCGIAYAGHLGAVRPDGFWAFMVILAFATAARYLAYPEKSK